MVIYDLLLVASALLFAGLAAGFYRHPAASLLHPLTMYLGFHGLVFVIYPILARIFDYQQMYLSFGFQPSVSDKITVILGANLGLLVFFAVSLAIAGQPFANVRDRFDEMQRRAMIKPFLITAILIAPIGFASALDEWFTRASQTSSMVFDPTTGASINTTAIGWFSEAQLALVPLVVGFAWMFRFRWWSLAPFAAFFVLRSGTGGRGPIIVAALAIAMLYLFENRKKWPEWRAALLLVVAAISFSFILVDRGKAVRELFIEDVTREYISSYQPAPLERMDFANLQFYEFLVYAVPQRTGTYDYFLSNLQVFTEPIPRAWWPDKPVGSPIQFYSLFDYGRPIGMTNSLPGTGWIELGYLGIIIQCGIFAAGYAWLYRILMTRNQSNLYLLTYVMMVAATLVTFRDGLLLTVMRLLPFYVGPLVVMWGLMIAYRTPSAAYFRALSTRHPGAAALAAGALVNPAERRKRLAAQDSGG